MKIGIDLDDTICRTTEIVHKKLEEYAENLNLNPLDIMNDESLKEEFFQKELKEAYKEVEIKREVKEVIKRLRNKGNKIYIITSRSDNYHGIDFTQITKDWFQKQNLEVDEMIFSVDGENKAKVCKEYQIDLMIEDNPYNFKKIRELGINCILYDDRGKFDLKQDYYTSWLEIEKYIERNH